MVSAYVLSGVAVLVAALGSLLYMETASVKISVQPQRLVANVTLSGGQSGGDLQTERIEASVTQAQDGTASRAFVGKYASGLVVLTCPGCNFPITVDSGTILTSTTNLGYATQAAATVMRTGSATVAVRATAPGTSWNTPARTVTAVFDSIRFHDDLRVTNPAAITGGADPRWVQAIQQSDLDAVRTTLAAKVTAAIDTALKAKAPQMTFVPDGPPVLTVITNHKVGEELPAFTMTMTGSVGATAFSDSQAQSLLRAALAAMVPDGQELTTDPIQTNYPVRQASPNGDLTVDGTAVGYVSPKLSTNTLRARIRGLSSTEARKSLLRAVPGSTVDIHTSPVAVQWLPLIAEHISITVLVLPPGQ